MNISQVEGKTGLARANIRFYEKQQLICPSREENDYRDYSEEDMLRLRRIKLLRQVGISIEEIRQIQDGTASLTETLNERLEEIQKHQQDEKNMLDVCQKICSDGMDYDNLNPEQYSFLFHRVPGQSDELANKIISQDVDAAYVPHPWIRMFARLLDIAICAVPVNIIWHFAFGESNLIASQTNNILESIVRLIFTIGIMAVTEPLLLSKCGTTIAKAIWGIRITNEDGTKLTYSQAFDRTWNVCAKGIGMNMPLLHEYRMLASYDACTEGPMPWDEGLSYTIKDTKLWRVGVYILVELALLAFSWLLTFGTK